MGSCPKSKLSVCLSDGDGWRRPPFYNNNFFRMQASTSHWWYYMLMTMNAGSRIGLPAFQATESVACIPSKSERIALDSCLAGSAAARNLCRLLAADLQHAAAAAAASAASGPLPPLPPLPPSALLRPLLQPQILSPCAHTSSLALLSTRPLLGVGRASTVST